MLTLEALRHGVHVKIVRKSQAAVRVAVERRSQKSSKRPLSLQQRRAIMASTPATLQCIPERLQRVPMASLQPASNHAGRNTETLSTELWIAHSGAIAREVVQALARLINGAGV